MASERTDKIRVLVVDNSASLRLAVIRMFEHNCDIEVVDVAADGEAALELTKRLRPDVIALDVQMPVVGGISILKRVMRECPTRVVMLSSLTGKGGEKTMDALDNGAVDFIDRSSAGGSMEVAVFARELDAKIRMAARVDLEQLSARNSRTTQRWPRALPKKSCDTEVVLIGASNGGPPALQGILSNVDPNVPYPILIVQHMPVGFTASLAKRLDRHSPLAIRVAMNGERIAAGSAYIAPSGWHMRLRRRAGNLHVWLDPAPNGHQCCPAVDALFESAADVCGSRCLAVVLTGTGNDGALGAQAIRKAGGRVMAEAEETAMAFGMPKAAIDADAVDHVVPLYQVPETIAMMV